MPKVQFTIPTATPSLNVWQRMHWGARKRLKAVFFEHCHAARVTSGADINTDQPVKVTITRYSGKRGRPVALDDDNLRGGCKGLVDGIVKAGLAVDDSPDWMTVEYVDAGKDGDGRTEVEVANV